MGGPRWLADDGTEPTASGGGGDGALVRKRAWVPAVQLQGEAEKVVGRLVWTI
jgi:hypothetical protein